MSISHFYLVFNPLLNESSAYPSQAHEFHAMFKQRVEQKQGNHFYWGKVRKSTTSEKLKVENYKKILEDNQALGQPTYLFISDFTNFWVAKVEDVCSEIKSYEETLSFYRSENVEVWFKVSDFDLLCTGAETNKRIAQLSSEKHESLNPYLGGLRYPLVVEDHMQGEYFAGMDLQPMPLRLLSCNPLIQSETIDEADKLKRTILSYCIPAKNFNAMPELIQKQVIWTEHLFCKVKGESLNDINTMEEIAFSYVRMLESLLNTTLIKDLKDVFASKIDRRILYSDKGASLFEILNVFSEGVWQNITIENELTSPGFKMKWNQMRGHVGPSLEGLIKNYKLVDFRNGRAHLDNRANNRLPFDTSLTIRNKILGVGSVGLLNLILTIYPVEEKKSAQKKAA